jgi:hypothetical protein
VQTKQTKLTMNIRKLLMPLAACLLVQTFAAHAELLLVNVRGTCRVVNERDRISNVAFNNTTLLQDFASQDPFPDPRSLRLVYDTEQDRISIVNVAGDVLGDVFTFGFPVVVSNSTETQRERHVFLFPPESADATGNAVLTERVSRNAQNAVTRRNIRGKFTFANAGSDVSAAEICTGTFTTARPFVAAPAEPEPEPQP